MCLVYYTFLYKNLFTLTIMQSFIVYVNEVLHICKYAYY